ncbi:hypothetical protein V6N13_047144 [Hibiscus sabdariffa]|uniref:Uncharacterized protein n=1 Tax=Hibiscus sabdariffa TaxID=183260 RepID=A0ABR2F388_9ROSI
MVGAEEMEAKASQGNHSLCDRQYDFRYSSDGYTIILHRKFFLLALPTITALPTAGPAIHHPFTYMRTGDG